MSDLQVDFYEDPHLWLFTSLTAGSSHIVTATSRLETILKANRIPFKAIDVATHEDARKLWGRRSGKDESGRMRKLPGLVQDGFVVGDLVEIEDWNEYGELKQHVKIVGQSSTPARPVPLPSEKKPSAPAAVSATKQGSAGAPAPKEEEKKPPVGGQPTAFTLAMRGLGEEAAQKAKELKKKATEVVEAVLPAAKAESEKAPETPKKETGSKAVKVEDVSKVVTTPVEAITYFQDPHTSAWSFTPGEDAAHLTDHSLSLLRSLQSPTSARWHPVDVNPPIRKHRGSEVSLASMEEIRKIEQSLTISEDPAEEEEVETAAPTVPAVTSTTKAEDVKNEEVEQDKECKDTSKKEEA
jgi:hypothetical protein